MRRWAWIGCGLLLGACAAAPMASRVTPEVVVAVHGGPPLSQGDATAGRDAFHKLRCDVCHSLAGEVPKKEVPLPDLSVESPELVAALIVSRTDVAPEALFNEIAMSAAASQMTMRQLADIVAYLRKPPSERSSNPGSD